MPDFLFGLNTSTIQPAGLMDKIRVASEAGYDAIELWAPDVEAYVEEGNSLSDVRKALDDAGLLRPSMIHLKDWHHPDAAKRSEALEAARRRLEIAKELGVARIVAGPPHGDVETAWVADCYRQLLELAADYEVWPSFEYLGFAEKFKTLDIAWEVLRLVDHPQATITADAWHDYRGGGGSAALDQIPPERISTVHWDDAPADIPREQQADPDRVMPGDGVIDLAAIANQLRRIGFSGVLSLELFNPTYWEQDPLEVAKLGLKKMKATVAGQA